MTREEAGTPGSEQSEAFGMPSPKTCYGGHAAADDDEIIFADAKIVMSVIFKDEEVLQLTRI